MKKTLIAASIAALATTSANAAVKLYESETGSFSSYGKVQLELENYDGENTIQNQGSRLGFSGEKQLENGLTAFTNFEFRFQPGVQNDDERTVRNSYLGVKGDFGSVKAGNFDSIVYTMVTEQADIMENKGYRSLDVGENNARGTAIAFETNDINGFKFGVGVKHYASEDTSYTNKLTQADLIAAVNAADTYEEVYDKVNNRLGSIDGKEQWNLQVGATYQLNDELSFGLAIDQNNKKGNPRNVDLEKLFNDRVIDTSIIVAASVNYETDQFGAGVVLENSGDYTVANLTGSVNYGAGDVYALVSFANMSDDIIDDSGVDFGLGVNYKMDKAFMVYGEVAVGNKKVSSIQVEKDDGTMDGTTAVTLGAAYKW